MKRITSNEIEKKPFVSCESFSNFKQLVVCEPCISRLIEDKQTFGLEKNSARKNYETASPSPQSMLIDVILV